MSGQIRLNWGVAKPFLREEIFHDLTRPRAPPFPPARAMYSYVQLTLRARRNSYK